MSEPKKILNILVVDANSERRSDLCNGLREDDRFICQPGSLQGIFSALEMYEFDIVLLDLSLSSYPDWNNKDFKMGYDIASLLSEHAQVLKRGIVIIPTVDRTMDDSFYDNLKHGYENQYLKILSQVSKLSLQGCVNELDFTLDSINKTRSLYNI